MSRTELERITRSRDPEAEVGLDTTYRGVYPPDIPERSAQDDPKLRRAQEDRLRAVWAQPKGWRYFSAVNNTVVRLWYMAAAFGFFLFAGVLALLMRTQLALPQNDFVDAETTTSSIRFTARS